MSTAIEDDPLLGVTLKTPAGPTVVVPPAVAKGFALPPMPGPVPYQTALAPKQELAFQRWLVANKIPFDSSPASDYDMRGFWLAQQNGDPRATQALNKSDGKMHFPDTWKTPFHQTFSNESIYATPFAPYWKDDQLVDLHGNVIADERPRVPAPTSDIYMMSPRGAD